MSEKFSIIFVVLQKVIVIIKMPFSTLRKLCCYYTEKGKIRPKNLVGRKCSVVIIMSVFHPLETFLANGAKNGQRLDYTQLTDRTYPILWGKKRTRLSAIYS